MKNLIKKIVIIALSELLPEIIKAVIDFLQSNDSVNNLSANISERMAAQIISNLTEETAV